ncbi:AmmeMemoRadiSam system radical SAM enzyme [Ferroplasma sp.]|uniref:AmmeMemoRadiSam system radical SAM enzyme n=1 Tax=Ferroplasma sp. TaxID=2591003 RepID=UPI00307D6168
MQASLFEIKGNKIRCTACARYCLLSNGQTGFCGVRTAANGVLNLDVYNFPYAFNIDPIEKKPVLHMFPGTRILSFGTAGCNFACKYCQNFDMSQRKEVTGSYTTPEAIIKMARKNKVDGIAFTYNEPTIFMEFARDVGVLAHKYGLFNIFVTNGYETPESMEMASEFLDAMTIDFKGNGEEKFYNKYISVMSANLIYRTIKNAIDYGIHTEITDLVIPEIGDNLEAAAIMVEKIRDIAGEYIPVSFLRYHPDYKLNIPSTPFETLKNHYDLARSMGMKYVYLGNVQEESYENTYCPNCGNLLISRKIFDSKIIGLDKNGNCTKCGFSTGIKIK